MKAQTYNLPADTRSEMPDQFGERFEWSHKAGEVKPTSEREEYLLEQLVNLGLAERVTTTKKEK